MAPVPRQRLSSERKKKRDVLLFALDLRWSISWPNTVKKYCAPFQVKGLTCADEGYTHSHVPFVMWTKEQNQAQCEYAGRNKNKMAFVAGTCIPDKFQHLFKNGERK